MIPHESKNLIFDLGGVIIDLDVFRTHRALAQLADYKGADFENKIADQTFFNDYEKGFLSDTEFRAQLKTFLKCAPSDEELDTAWNAMLLTISPEKYTLLQRLRMKYRLILLSNTNNIHLTEVNRTVRADTGHPGIDHFFHKAYYSHVMKMRKPDPDIFKQVIRENSFLEKETVFLDDNLENVRSAESLGIRTVHITSPNMILSLFA